MLPLAVSTYSLDTHGKALLIIMTLKDFIRLLARGERSSDSLQIAVSELYWRVTKRFVKDEKKKKHRKKIMCHYYKLDFFCVNLIAIPEVSFICQGKDTGSACKC